MTVPQYRASATHNIRVVVCLSKEVCIEFQAVREDGESMNAHLYVGQTEVGQQLNPGFEDAHEASVKQLTVQVLLRQLIPLPPAASSICARPAPWPR